MNTNRYTHKHNENVLYFLPKRRRRRVLNSHYLYYASVQLSVMLLATKKRWWYQFKRVFFALRYVTDYCYHHSFVRRHQKKSGIVCMQAYPVTTFVCTFPVYCDDDND